VRKAIPARPAPKDRREILGRKETLAHPAGMEPLVHRAFAVKRETRGIPVKKATEASRG
jgi:hypothetical protein